MVLSFRLWKMITLIWTTWLQRKKPDDEGDWRSLKQNRLACWILNQTQAQDVVVVPMPLMFHHPPRTIHQENEVDQDVLTLRWVLFYWHGDQVTYASMGIGTTTTTTFIQADKERTRARWTWYTTRRQASWNNTHIQRMYQGRRGSNRNRWRWVSEIVEEGIQVIDKCILVMSDWDVNSSWTLSARESTQRIMIWSRTRCQWTWSNEEWILLITRPLSNSAMISFSCVTMHALLTRKVPLFMRMPTLCR